LQEAFAGRLEIVILIFLLFMVLLAQLDGGSGSALMAALVVGPGIALTLMSKAIVLLRSDSRFVFFPMIWFRLAASTYCGLGIVIPIIVNQRTDAYIRGLYNFTPAEHLQVMNIYLLGLILLLLYTRFWSWFLQRTKMFKLSTERVNLSTPSLKLIITLLVAGAILRYGAVLPVALGLSPGITGFLIHVSRLFYVGLLLISFRGRKGPGSLGVVAFLILCFDIFVSSATFSKAEVLMGVIFYQLGRLFYRSSVTELVRTALMVGVVYLVFQPAVHDGREQIRQQYGPNAEIGIVERWGILADYVLDTEVRTERASDQNDAQLGLLRLSYVNADAFVIHQADQGLYNNTLQYALAALVPRVLWPDKPEIWRQGVELSYLIFRSMTSSTGITVFGEMYWLGGWASLVLVTLLPAFILCLYSHISWSVVSQGRWLLLPLALIGINIAIRVDGFIVLDFIGPAATGLAMYPILALFERRWRLSSQ
jgi:hypothetical protein